MERTAVQKLAKVLKILVLVMYVVNLLCLPLVPGMVVFRRDFSHALELWKWFTLGNGEGLTLLGIICIGAFRTVVEDLEIGLLSLFFWTCGVCTALILWQAKEVLDTVLEGEPFQMRNAETLNRAAVCCWVISGAALVKLALWLWMERNIAPLFTYDALFIPAFLMAGLLFQVMSALFRQAAELKEDQDLTI